MSGSVVLVKTGIHIPYNDDLIWDEASTTGTTKPMYTYILDQSLNRAFQGQWHEQNSTQLLKTPTGRRWLSWLFTSAAQKLNQGLNQEQIIQQVVQACRLHGISGSQSKHPNHLAALPHAFYPGPRGFLLFFYWEICDTKH